MAERKEIRDSLEADLNRAIEQSISVHQPRARAKAGGRSISSPRPAMAC